MSNKKANSRLTKALLETAEGMHETGILSETTYNKITLRHLRANKAAKPLPMTAKQIRAVRERAKMSQAVFARYLNLSPGYISQLERGTKQPTGPALALLNVIRRKEIEAIL